MAAQAGNNPLRRRTHRNFDDHSRTRIFLCKHNHKHKNNNPYMRSDSASSKPQYGKTKPKRAFVTTSPSTASTGRVTLGNSRSRSGAMTCCCSAKLRTKHTPGSSLKPRPGMKRMPPGTADDTIPRSSPRFNSRLSRVVPLHKTTFTYKKGAGDPSPAHSGGALTIAPPPYSASSRVLVAAIPSANPQRFNPMQHTGDCCAGTPTVTPRHGRHSIAVEQSLGQHFRHASARTNHGRIRQKLPVLARNAAGIARGLG